VLLATLWWPNTNPVGPASLWPLGIVVTVAAIQRLRNWRVLAFGAPAVFALLAVLSAGFPFAGYRRFPDAEDYAGYYIWNLAACCFALEVARSGSLGSLVYGGVLILPMGWLLVVEIIARSSQLIEGSRNLSVQQIVLASSVVWLVLYAALMYRAARPYKCVSRIAHGLCGRCGYNMRESPERCPECGEPVAVRPAG
jgi:hypothetical protein